MTNTDDKNTLANNKFSKEKNFLDPSIFPNADTLPPFLVSKLVAQQNANPDVKLGVNEVMDKIKKTDKDALRILTPEETSVYSNKLATVFLS